MKQAEQDIRKKLRIIKLQRKAAILPKPADILEYLGLHIIVMVKRKGTNPKNCYYLDC